MYWSAGERPLHGSRLSKLLTLYEQNYVQLRLLLPALKQLPVGVYWSRHPACLDLRVQVLEQARYTSTINLSYVFDHSRLCRAAPDLQVRVYHDARSAEVLSGLIHGHRYTRRSVRSLIDSWQANRFLYKWLRYCRFREHALNEGLPPTERDDTPPVTG